MDIKEKLGDLTEKVKDKDFKDDLKKDPIKAVEGLTGIDIPEDKVDKVVDVAKDKLGDVFDKLKKYLWKMRCSKKHLIFEAAPYKALNEKEIYLEKIY